MKILKLLIWLFAGMNALNAQVILPPSDTIYLGLGQTYDIKVQNIYAYCLAETGFYRINISDPQTMIVKNHLPLAGGGNEYCKVLIAGGTAFIANGTGGLVIVNIADTNSLTQVSGIQNIGNVTELAIKNDALYVLNYSSDLIRIISVADSANPSIINTFNCSGSWNLSAYSMEVIGNYLFCAGRYSRIWRWNISNPFYPSGISLMDQYWAGDYRQTFYDAVNNYLFVDDNSSDMKTYQVNPATGQLSRITQSHWYGNYPDPSRLYKMNNLVYITAPGSSRINIWDVSNISSPVKVNEIYPSQNDFYNCTSLFLTSNNCYLGVSSQVVAFPINVATAVGRIDKRGYYSDLVIRSQYLYTATGPEGLRIYNLADPDHPSFIQGVDFGSPLDKVYSLNTDNILYCICNPGVYDNKVHIVDVSNPSSPVVLGFMRVPWKAESNYYCNIADIVVNQNYAYLLYYYETGYIFPELSDYGIAVFNISNLSNPLLLGKYTTVSWPVSFVLDENTLLTVERRYYAEPGVYTGTNCVAKYSITTPQNPQFVQSTNITDYPIDLAKGSDTLFIISGQIYNSSEYSANTVKYINKTSLTINQTYSLYDTPEFIISEAQNLFLSNYSHELNIINKSPYEIVDSSSFQFATGHFELNSPRVYLCNGYALTTLSIELPPDPPLLVYPPDNSTGIGLTPTLDWENSTGAVQYGVQISLNESFTSIIHQNLSLTSSNYTVPASVLGANTNYFWRVNASNSAGTSDWSATWDFTTGIAVPPTRELQNITIHNGDDECYDATQTIIVAGNGTTFIIQNGGDATMIAGQTILLMPGTLINSGGYLLADITTTGQYCAALPSAPMSDDPLEKEIESAMEMNTFGFTVNPNPSSGPVTLEFDQEAGPQDCFVEILSMTGTRVIAQELKSVRSYHFNLIDQAPGIYTIRVVRGDRVDAVRIIKN